MEGEDELRMESGLDWEFLLRTEVPVAWMAEASGEAGDRICGLCIDTRFLGWFLEARGESCNEPVVGVEGFEVDEGLFPIVRRGGWGRKGIPPSDG